MGTGSATVATVKPTGVVKKAPTQPVAPAMRPTTASQREAKSNPVMGGARVSAAKGSTDTSKLDA